MTVAKRKAGDTLESVEKRPNKIIKSGNQSINLAGVIKNPLEDFMKDLPPMKGSVALKDDSPLPCSYLSKDELQNTEYKGGLRSAFNVKLPMSLSLPDNSLQHDDAADNVLYKWMRNQYAHCIIPEAGEEYGFAFDSWTFHTLRDLHNARVRIRDSEYLPDYIVCSIATRWISFEEKDRPAADGYLANGEIFVATCLPLTVNESALRQYFEMHYSTELSAQHYIPRSKYSVHFVGNPILNTKLEDAIQNVHIQSVLIRNTRTGGLVYIDTGDHTARQGRAIKAMRVLNAWLEFQKDKCPGAKLGPIHRTPPIVLDVDKETTPSLRSLHAPVSASLFLRRRITNWGDVKAFHLRNGPNSTAVANYALRNLSGWLGLSARSTILTSATKANKEAHSFQYIYMNGGLLGRDKPRPGSQHILSAANGTPPVFNEEPDGVLSDDDSDHEDIRTNITSDSFSDDEEIVLPDQPNSNDSTPREYDPEDGEPTDATEEPKNDNGPARSDTGSNSKGADEKSPGGGKSERSPEHATEQPTKEGDTHEVGLDSDGPGSGAGPSNGSVSADKEGAHGGANAGGSSRGGDADKDTPATT